MENREVVPGSSGEQPHREVVLESSGEQPYREVVPGSSGEQPHREVVAISGSEKIKNFSSAVKNNIYNVFCNFYESAKSTRSAVRMAADTLKITQRSVWRVLKEKKLSGVLISPRRAKGRPSLVETLDEHEKSLIRRKMHEFFFRNEIPTLDKLHAVIERDTDIPHISRSGLYTVLKHLSIKYTARKRDSLLLEREDIVTWRRRYMRRIRELRQLGKKMYYLDETWVNEGITKSKVWTDTTVTSSRQAFIEGLSTGLKNPQSKGKRLIILHIGNEDGFVEDGLLLFESKKTGDYHEDMNAQVFEEWFSNILPKLQQDSVIIMDNAPYHSRKIEKIPTQQWKKNDIKQWLNEKAISFSEDMVKAELLTLAKAKKNDFEKYAVDEMAREGGHTVLRLPPYHCELNPIELVWAQIKGDVARKNTTFKLKDVKILLQDAVNSITAQEWSNCVRHVVETVEKRMWDIDTVIDTTTERLMITLADDSSESDFEELEPQT